MKNPSPTQIQKQLGVKIRVVHLRYVKNQITGQNELITRRDIPSGSVIQPKGGIVKVTFENPNGKFEGQSVCSLSDIFNKRLGLNKALGRAIQKAYHAEKNVQFNLNFCQ